MKNQAVGKIGEMIARETARKRHYAVKDINVRTPYGEIDLILEKNDRIFFVEVKTRTSYRFGFPEEAVNQEKMSHMIQNAEYYLNDRQLSDKGWQLDVISILLDQSTQLAREIQWIENITADE
jgi:putative endonuclease